MRVRSLVLILLALLCTAVLAAPAGAQDQQDGSDQRWEDGREWEEGEGWDEPPAADPDPAPAPPAPVPTPDPPLPQPVTDVFDDGTPTEPEPAPEPAIPTVPVPKGKTIKGKVALIRADGTAAIPRGAPKTVRTLIRAANAIVGKPYKWGGGHARLIDRGYDCSGAVSYALIDARLLAGPQVSGTLARYGSGGAGRWVTVFANAGHVYLEVAGLRLDTSANGDPSNRSGVRWRPVIGKRRGFAVRHPAGL